MKKLKEILSWLIVLSAIWLFAILANRVAVTMPMVTTIIALGLVVECVLYYFVNRGGE